MSNEPLGSSTAGGGGEVAGWQQVGVLVQGACIGAIVALSSSSLLSPRWVAVVAPLSSSLLLSRWVGESGGVTSVELESSRVPVRVYLH